MKQTQDRLRKNSLVSSYDSKVEIFTLATKSSNCNVTKMACGGADEDSELLHLQELLAMEEKKREQCNVKAEQRRNTERFKE